MEVEYLLIGKTLSKSKLDYLVRTFAVCDHSKFTSTMPNVVLFLLLSIPYSYAMSTVKLNFTGQCWASRLCDYFITIHYKQCIQNKVPDFLSESPIETAVQRKCYLLMKSKPYYVL